MKLILDYLIYLQKTIPDCSFSFLGNPLPMKLRSHSIVTIGGDIIVIGGVPDDAQCKNFQGNAVCKALYKLSCKSGNCQWTTLPQSLEFSRTDMVALAIPDDFFDCK